MVFCKSPVYKEESIVKYFKIIGKDKMYNYMKEAGFGDALKGK